MNWMQATETSFADDDEDLEAAIQSIRSTGRLNVLQNHAESYEYRKLIEHRAEREKARIAEMEQRRTLIAKEREAVSIGPPRPTPKDVEEEILGRLTPMMDGESRVTNIRAEVFLPCYANVKFHAFGQPLVVEIKFETRHELLTVLVGVVAQKIDKYIQETQQRINQRNATNQGENID